MDREVFALSPKRITALYLVFGVVWVGTTDALVVGLVESTETITLVQTAKGWVFVALSGLLLYGLAYFHHRQLEDSQRTLQTASEQLQVLHRVFRHNIRNDLNVVLSNIDLLMRQVQEPRKEDSLEVAKRTAKRIVSTSEKLRVLDSLELNGSDNVVDLVGLTVDAVETVRRRYPDVDIETNIPETAPVYGDFTIYRAVVELVENAVEHNPNPPEECEVSVTIARQNGTVELEVTDNGTSIPEHEVESLRAEMESDLAHMSGVGLWMVKWVCECHGGEFDVETDVTDGATVLLTFERVDRPVVEQVTETVSGVRTIPS